MHRALSGCRSSAARQRADEKPIDLYRQRDFMMTFTENGALVVCRALSSQTLKQWWRKIVTDGQRRQQSRERQD